MSKKTFGKKPKEILSVKLVRPSNTEKHWILFSGGFPIPGRFGIGAALAIASVVILSYTPDTAVAKELAARVFDIVLAVWELRPTNK